MPLPFILFFKLFRFLFSDYGEETWEKQKIAVEIVGKDNNCDTNIQINEHDTTKNVINSDIQDTNALVNITRSSNDIIPNDICTNNEPVEIDPIDNASPVVPPLTPLTLEDDDTTKIISDDSKSDDIKDRDTDTDTDTDTDIDTKIDHVEVNHIETIAQSEFQILKNDDTVNIISDTESDEAISHVETDVKTSDALHIISNSDDTESHEPTPICIPPKDTNDMKDIETDTDTDTMISNEVETPFSAFSDDTTPTQNENVVLQNHDTVTSNSSEEQKEMIPIDEEEQESDEMVTHSNLHITIDPHPYMFTDEDDDDDTPVPTEETDEYDAEMLAFKRYTSAGEMLDDESIEGLLKMELIEDVMDIVGDRSLYELPLDEVDALFHLERDLRKIKYSLNNLKSSAQRKYAKITILKHYKMLNAIYSKYCKIGGDRHWMNFDGYISLLRDVGIIRSGKYSDNERYFEIFHEIYMYHSKHSHKKRRSTNKSALSKQLSGLYGIQSFHDDKDPWTGVWCKQKDQQRIYRIEMKRKTAMENRTMLQRKKSIKERAEQYYEKYKLRKIGDKRIIGCMNNIQYAEIGGTFEKSNYKQAKMEIKFKKRRIKVYNQHRMWCCELIPPKSLVDDIKMKVNWEEINPKSSQIKRGTFVLYKHEELADDDIDIPIPQYVGLSRSEFFDAMLSCSSVMCSDNGHAFLGGSLGNSDDECKQDLYIRFDRFVVQYLDEYIYKHHCELERYLKGKEIKEEVKEKLKTYNAVLIKLFKKYASMDNSEITTKQAQEIDVDEWTAMALELCNAAKTFEKDIWKCGGKPAIIEIIQCFTLSADGDILNQDEISFVEFQRCLVIFTNAIFKYQPKAKYNVLRFHDKLDLVLKWCEKLEAQKMKISSGFCTQSDTLKQIKRRRDSGPKIGQYDSIPILSPKRSSVAQGVGNLSVTHKVALLLRSSV